MPNEIMLDRPAGDNLKKKLRQAQDYLSENTEQLRKTEASAGRLQYINLNSNISQTRTKMETTVKKLKIFERAHEEYTQEIERFDRDAAQLLRNVPEIQKLEIHPGWIADPFVVIQNLGNKLVKEGVGEDEAIEIAKVTLLSGPYGGALTNPRPGNDIRKQIEDKEKKIAALENEFGFGSTNITATLRELEICREELNQLKQIAALENEFGFGSTNITATLRKIQECKKRLEELRNPVLVNEGSENPAITVNDWLELHANPTVTSEGRTVNCSGGYSFENLTNINKWAGISIQNTTGIAPTVNVGNKGELTDGDGRYWIAVGPNVMNPNHDKDKAVTADEMKYGTFIDVVVQDSSGKTYYIPAVVGDAKAHTYPTGIVQTGNAFPSGTDSHPQNNDGSVVEFIGATLPMGLSEYKIVSIIVYDK